MDSRKLIGGVVVAGALIALGLWWKSSTAPLDGVGPAAAGKQEVAKPAPRQPEVPKGASVQPPLAQTDPDKARKEEALPELVLEPVEPLLELNLVVAGASGAVSADGQQTELDGLLEGRHGTKTRAQLEQTWRSILYVLDKQKDPNSIPKDKILSAESISALEIEAGWLKERIFR